MKFRLLHYKILIATVFASLTIIGKASAQNFPNIINYNLNNYATHGIKIKTNLPFYTSTQMPTISITGYDYYDGEVIDLKLVYYIYYDTVEGGYRFVNASVSSAGGFAPKVYLSNENGKVVIFLDDKGYYTRFTVSAFAQGIAEQSSWFSNWTAADEPLSGLKTIEVSYKNKFAGTVRLPGNGVWNSKGQVGIGTLDPAQYSQLDVVGGYIQTRPTLADAGYHLVGRSGIDINNSTYFQTRSSEGWELLGANKIGNVSLKGLAFTMGGDGVVNAKMAILPSGNVGIGTISPEEKLSVKGKILAQEITIKPTGWADYVFEKSYQLQALSDIEEYISKNKRLPGIQSAAEVEKNGVGLGEMNAKLLAKIEELTLYLINHNKELNLLKEQIKCTNNLEKRISELEESLLNQMR